MRKRRKKKKLIIKNLIKLIVLVLILIFLIILTCHKIKTSKHFTITFDTLGGTTVKEEKVKYGEKAYYPADPTREGYEFVGWYLGEKEFNFENKITKKLTLTAKWKKIEEVKPDEEIKNNDENNGDKKDKYPFDHITNADAKRIFSEKHAMVVSDSMGEGLSAYGVLNEENVVWHRGRRVDNMNLDMDKVKAFNPTYLFMSYSANDLKWWNGKTDKFIESYRNQIENIRKELPSTKIINNSVLPVAEKAIEKDKAFTYQKEFNEALKKLAKELNIDFIENESLIYANEKPFSSDGIHPRSFFFYLWGRHMASYLEKN